MTLVRNRAGRVYARRLRALERLQAGLKSGVRFSGLTHDCLHDQASRARANAEADRLALLVAKPPVVTFTRKSKRFGEWSAARKAHQSGKFA